MGGKWLGLLKEIAARVTRVALVFNPVTAPFAEQYVDPFKGAAASLAVEAMAVRVQQACTALRNRSCVVAVDGRDLNRSAINVAST